jgi:hypothetical protein
VIQITTGRISLEGEALSAPENMPRFEELKRSLAIHAEISK